MTESKITFTPEQKKAIEHNKGHLRIIACAGSGKTEVISQRTAQLIKGGVKPKNIVAFTFTEKAADELKSRIRKILDRECPERADFGEMYVGTIHSFCFEKLKELEPVYKSYDVLDDAKRVAYISKYRNFNRMKLWPIAVTKAHKRNYYYGIDKFIYGSDIMMMEDVDAQLLTNPHFKYAYLEYKKMLEEDRYLDFSSMIYTLVDILKNNPAVFKKFSEEIKHLIVDEYQDVNKLQEELVELISVGADSVCVVGDDDQCIYQWRGSHVENIVTFKERYSKKYKVADVTQEMNFRSTESIVHTAKEFIKHNRNRISKENMTHNPELKRIYEKGDIIHTHFANEGQEFDFIVNKIKELIGTDFIDKHNNPFSLSLGNFAVLVRTNDDAARVIDHMDRNGIKSIAYSGNSIFGRPEVLFAMECIAYVFNCAIYPSESPPLLNVLKVKYLQVLNHTEYPSADAEKFSKKLEKIKEGIDKIAKKDPKDYLGDLGLQAVYHKILNALGTEDFDIGVQYNYNLASLSTAISDYESVWKRLRTVEIKDFFRFIGAYGKGHYVEMMHADETLLDAVKVLTIHKAKGLEFPVVFVPGLVEKKEKSPVTSLVDENLYNVERYNGTEEDERRIFYTAITRSEKYLFLTGSKNRPEVQKEYEPHRFIGELDRKFISGNMVLKRGRHGHPAKISHTAIYPTSFSELTTYDRCPHDFKLRHVYGFNAGVPAAFGYGTNIHNILNLIHKRYVEHKKVPDNDDIDKIFDKLFMLRYATDKIADNMKKSGKQVVKNYVGLHKDQFKYILETEKRFEFVIEEGIISGQIDLIKKTDEEGNITEVEIIDFKTEDNKSPDEKIYQLDHEKQLRFYAIACLKSLGLTPKKACVHYLHKSRDKKDYVDISPKHLDITKEEIKTDIKSILSKSFTAKPSKICSKCDYRYICFNKKFKMGN